MQLQHHSTNFKTQKHAVVLLCDSVKSPANMGSLFRIADSFGVEKLIFGNISVDKTSNRLKRTARATQNWVVMEHEISTLKAIKEYTKNGYHAIALEITQKSLPISELKLNKSQKILLIIGDESGGISSEVLQQCNDHKHITMYGKNSSMNVSQATAIALYEITKQLQKG